MFLSGFSAKIISDINLDEFKLKNMPLTRVLLVILLVSVAALIVGLETKSKVLKYIALALFLLFAGLSLWAAAAIKGM